MSPSSKQQTASGLAGAHLRNKFDSGVGTVLDQLCSRLAEWWQSGEPGSVLQEVLLGRTTFGSAIDALAGEASQLLQQSLAQSEEAAEQEVEVNRRVETALVARLREQEPRPTHRVRKGEYLVRGTISAESDGTPVAGLIVEVLDAGQQRVLAVDVSDARGRYEVVLPAEEQTGISMGGLEVIVRAGLCYAVAALESEPLTLALGRATPLDLRLAEHEQAALRRYEGRVDELHLDRLRSLADMTAVRSTGRQHLDQLGGALTEALSRMRSA